DGNTHSKVLQLRPDPSGRVGTDIQALIDPYLEHELPRLDKYAMQVSRKHLCRIQVSVTATNDYEVIDSIAPKTYYVMKGGLPRENNNITAFLEQNILSEHQFLRYPFPAEQ